MFSPILLTIGDNIDKAFYAFDLWVFRFFGSMQCGFLTGVAKFFTAFGDENFTIPIVVLSVVLCFFKRTRKYGFSILFAVIIGTLITNVIAKPMVLRIRPYNTLQQNADYWSWYIGAGALSESDYSFPSGHTTSAVEVATALFLCFKSDKKKIAWLFPCVALCTMGSRVYLMVHYATDVLGGLLVGVIAAVLGCLLMKLVMKIQAVQKGARQGGLCLHRCGGSWYFPVCVYSLPQRRRRRHPALRLCRGLQVLQCCQGGR